jgi:hypothetical protein
MTLQYFISADFLNIVCNFRCFWAKFKGVYKLKIALNFVVCSCLIKANFKESHPFVLLIQQKLNQCFSNPEFGQILV